VTRVGELGITLAITSKRSILGTIVFLRSVHRLFTANVVPSSPILVTLMMEELRSSETWVLTRATLRNIPGDGTLLSHCRVRSYINC
jgi:hypothetical protein